jgi:hypothetical protein
MGPAAGRLGNLTMCRHSLRAIENGLRNMLRLVEVKMFAK